MHDQIALIDTIFVVYFKEKGKRIHTNYTKINLYLEYLRLNCVQIQITAIQIIIEMLPVKRKHKCYTLVKLTMSIYYSKRAMTASINKIRNKVHGSCIHI